MPVKKTPKRCRNCRNELKYTRLKEEHRTGPSDTGWRLRHVNGTKADCEALTERREQQRIKRSQFTGVDGYAMLDRIGG